MNVLVLQRTGVIGALVLVLLGSGCQSHQNRLAFRQGVNESLVSVQGGDLKAARANLDQVKDKAESFADKRLVQSVDGLICGAQALMDGQVDDAKLAWSRIEDPQLNREIRIKASAVMGLDVPMIADEDLEKEVK